MIYRTVNTDIWRDPWFLDLAPASKCLFMYLFTNQSVSACGAMEISLSQIAFETKMPTKQVTKELEAFGDKILWLPEHNLIVVRNFYKHQRRQSSPTFTVAAKKALADLPIAAKTWLIGVYSELGDTPQVPPPYPTPTLGGKEAVTVTAAEAVTEPVTGVPPFVPPRDPNGSRIPDDFAVSDDVRQWAASKGFSSPEIDHHAERFGDYWRAESGARARKKDWDAALRTWIGKESPGRWKPSPVSLLPPGVSWDDVQQWRERRRHGLSNAGDRDRILDELDGKAGQAA